MSRDAIHAATMINNGIKEIISTDAILTWSPSSKGSIRENSGEL